MRLAVTGLAGLRALRCLRARALVAALPHAPGVLVNSDSIALPAGRALQAGAVPAFVPLTAPVLVNDYDSLSNCPSRRTGPCLHVF